MSSACSARHLDLALSQRVGHADHRDESLDVSTVAARSPLDHRARFVDDALCQIASRVAERLGGRVGDGVTHQHCPREPADRPRIRPRIRNSLDRNRRERERHTRRMRFALEVQRVGRDTAMHDTMLSRPHEHLIDVLQHQCDARIRRSLAGG